MNIVTISGIRLAAMSAGIKKNQNHDLVALEIAPGASVAAVFTQNAFCAAPVTVARRHLASAVPRCLIINAGNANAGTGQSGLEDAERCCALVADSLGCDPEQVLPFSTGVIGENLPMDKISRAIPELIKNLDADAWATAANAILTTDTRPKLLSRQVQLDNETVTITGMAKGAGMIRPNMATLLAYICTDANIDQFLLAGCLRYAAAASFNRITVDGDTSTNDSCVLVATNKSAATPIREEKDPRFIKFRAAVTDLCAELAKELIRDAEGATKLVTVNVTGGYSSAECKKTAYTIAHSPLTKTALFASDPNWGRILAAVGRSGIEGLDVNKVVISLDDVVIAKNGGRDPSYREADAQRIMDKTEFSINVDLGRGAHNEHVWTCDFSYDYVKINAEYRS